MFHVHQSFYVTISGLLFLAFGIVHGLRVAYGWDIVYGGYILPMWVSWVIVVVVIILVLGALKLRKG